MDLKWIGDRCRRLTLTLTFSPSLQWPGQAAARPVQRAGSAAVRPEGEAGQRGRRPPGCRLLLHADGPGGERILPQQGRAAGHEDGRGEVGRREERGTS